MKPRLNLLQASPEPMEAVAALAVVEWLTGDECHALDDAGFVAALGPGLRGSGMALDRLSLDLRILHPELDPPTAAWLLWQHGFSRQRDREKVPYLRRLSSLVAGLAVTAFLGSPFGPALAQDAATSAALAGEAAHAQKMGKLFPDTGTGTQATPAVIPTVDNDDDRAGRFRHSNRTGLHKPRTTPFFRLSEPTGVPASPATSRRTPGRSARNMCGIALTRTLTSRCSG